LVSSRSKGLAFPRSIDPDANSVEPIKSRRVTRESAYALWARVLDFESAIGRDGERLIIALSCSSVQWRLALIKCRVLARSDCGVEDFRPLET
jgi:hypothetical protein